VEVPAKRVPYFKPSKEVKLQLAAYPNRIQP
jgi:nucleoid DNA-binding protein